MESELSMFHGVNHMTEDYHKNLLHSDLECSSVWLTAQRRGQEGGQLIRWRPVVEVSTARVIIGLSDSGRWVRVTSESFVEWTPSIPPVFLLPVLEVEAASFRSLLASGVRAQGLDASVVESFPFNEIIATGLTSGSEYWATLALQWVPETQIVPIVAVALRQLAQSGPTQATRQAARRRVRVAEQRGELCDHETHTE